MPKYECYVETPVKKARTTMILKAENKEFLRTLLELGGWTVLFIWQIEN